MFYTIYKITNQIDGKFYIGSHKTKDLNDNYTGSGKYLIHAQKKYGIENFKKEILFVFETADEMYAKEAEIVNEDFLATENTYNLKIGGLGGWDYINENMKVDTKSKAGRLGYYASRESLRKTHGVDHVSKLPEVKQKQSARMSMKYPPGTTFCSFAGKQHSEDTKKKIGESAKVTSRGEKNSQYGTRWIHSLEEKISKKVSKDIPLPEGWVEGRKMKF